MVGTLEPTYNIHHSSRPLSGRRMGRPSEFIIRIRAKGGSKPINDHELSACKLRQYEYNPNSYMSYTGLHDIG